MIIVMVVAVAAAAETGSNFITIVAMRSEWDELCCPGVVREPIGKSSSHATRQGTLVFTVVSAR